MNWDRLKQGEEDFLRTYPGGFAHPDMQEISRKHHPDKMRRMAAERLAPGKFREPVILADSVIRIVTASSMISVFDKPRFRDEIRRLDARKTAALARGMEQLLHGDQGKGFDTVRDLLAELKLARWPLMTVCPVYLHPYRQVFVKPTTAKNIITYFQVPGLVYRSRPEYDFYRSFRELILEMKSRVDSSLSPDNAAFTGFLMMVMEGL